jgi:hypothetical protein
MKTVDVTLVSVTGLRTATLDDPVILIGGTIFAKEITRDGVEKNSELLFEAHLRGVRVGQTIAVGKTKSLNIANDKFEIDTKGENLAIGGTLLEAFGGSSRYLIVQHYKIKNIIVDPGAPAAGVPPTQGPQRYRLEFSSADNQEAVRADFDVEVVQGAVV